MNTYDDDDYDPEKRMWLIHGAATGFLPLEEVGEMTDEEREFYEGVKAGREADRKAGRDYIYEMPCSWGSSF